MSVTKVKQLDEAILNEALAWKLDLDPELDAEEIARKRKRLRQSEAADLLWQYEAVTCNT